MFARELALSNADSALLAGSALASPTQAQHEVEGRLLLYIIVSKSATILQLLACKDETLLIGRDALLVLDFRLHHIDRVARFDLERDSLAGERLDEDLHGSF